MPKSIKCMIKFFLVGLLLSLPGCAHKLGVEPVGSAQMEKSQPMAFGAMPMALVSSPAVNWSASPLPMEPEQENYAYIAESGFRSTASDPLSTFSVDVDTAAYSNVRRILQDGMLPPPDAVRIEELVNYFKYDYPAPVDAPVSITSEVAVCPWAPEHLLLQIGLKARTIDMGSAAANNLVFLLDVSGSMGSPDKLPLLVSALKLLTRQLRPQDQVAVVVYAGASGVILPPTSGARQAEIMAALDELGAGGSTAGGEGIELAYDLAGQMFSAKANNRVILATDGDFNVGVTSQGELIRLIEKKRDSGVFLSVFGFGRQVLNDATMESLADHGNGQYAYIDSLLEAKRVLVEQLGGSLVTVAKDVKLQVEFNPALVSSYRLIGYENRRLENRDFDDDKKDAGDMGAGHTVTALYELIAAEGGEAADPALHYSTKVLTADAGSGESLAFVKYRFKEPASQESRMLTHEVKAAGVAEMSANLGFASAVAEWGMLLRNSPNKGGADYLKVAERAAQYRGADGDGLRGEFLRLVNMSSLLAEGK